MATRDAHSFLSAVSDQELQEIESAAKKKAAETWVTTLAGFTLIYVSPLVLLSLLVRAAERSGWLDITLWLAFVALCAWAYLRWRALNLARALAEACALERQRRI